jgi:hypothetical protein
MDTFASHRRVRLGRREKPAPLDLSHHYSAVTKRRMPSKIKEAYKFFQIPGILNMAGGSCYIQLQCSISLNGSQNSLNPTY